MTLPETRLTVLNLLKESVSRDEAWRVFESTYREVVQRWCRRKLPESTADDVTQEIMMKLFVALPAHEHDEARGKFRSWLKSVVENSIRDYFRNKGQSGIESARGGDDFDRMLQNCAASIDELVTQLEERRMTMAERVVQKVRANVSEQSWEIFEQLAREDSPAAEVAKVFGLTVGAVYKVKFRVTKALREELSHVGHADSMS